MQEIRDKHLNVKVGESVRKDERVREESKNLDEIVEEFNDLQMREESVQSVKEGPEIKKDEKDEVLAAIRE